jgi:FkbM family methyltransferase
LRDFTLRHAARVLLRSGTFRRHLGSFDPMLELHFLRAVSLIQGATDEQAIFVRDLVNSTYSNAQINQDLWVLHETRRKRCGYFVEIGAADGIDLSNTLLLERDFGWQGILAEPNPVWHAALRRNRKAALDYRCVYSRTGDRVQFAATCHAGLATILEFLSTDGHAKSRMKYETIEVETVSLNDLLEAHAAPHTIDYISIDTEGSELRILEGFDFAKWDVKLFSIEHNLTSQEQALDRLMQQNGYERRYARYSLIDAWYRKLSG